MLPVRLSMREHWGIDLPDDVQTLICPGESSVISY
jgi:hypothetical protein